jgi:hypothetical protein
LAQVDDETDRQAGHHALVARLWFGSGFDVRYAVAFLALFSGIALLLNIIFSVDLRLGLGALVILVVGAFASLLRRASDAERRTILRTLAYGAVAGVIGTLVYDVARTILAIIDQSPYRPFEAIVVFGQLLLGSQARDAGVILTGGLFHILNGSSFGVAFTFVAVTRHRIGIKRLIALGVGWGLFLESFQMLLYPDWLGITYFREFLTISALGHVAYGATLGPTARALLSRGMARPSGGEAVA